MTNDRSTDGENFEPLGEMLDRRASAERLDELEQRPLLRRPREGARRDGGATADRGEIAATRRVRRAGSGAACDASAAGSARSNRDAERHDVVLGHPRAERQERRAKHRFRVGERENRLRRDAARRRLRRSDDDADLAPAAKRHDGTHADLRTGCLRVVDLVRESAKEREGERDGDEHAESYCRGRRARTPAADARVSRPSRASA